MATPSPDESQSSASAIPLSPTSGPTGSLMSDADVAAVVGPSVVQVVTDLATGSGVQVQGGILTNAHVVSGASRIGVNTSDKRYATARVVRLDNNGDLALLQTDLSIPTLQMEFMGQQRQGDEVLVLGYPLGLNDGGGQATLTRGIISATMTDARTGQALIQTDAAVNHGNSGGAMVNMRGDLIGIPSYGLRANGAEVDGPRRQQGQQSSLYPAKVLSPQW